MNDKILKYSSAIPDFTPLRLSFLDSSENCNTIFLHIREVT